MQHHLVLYVSIRLVEEAVASIFGAILYFSTLKMQASVFFETFVQIYQTTWLLTSEDASVNVHCVEDFQISYVCSTAHVTSDNMSLFLSVEEIFPYSCSTAPAFN